MLRLSARNQFAGTVREVRPGATTTHVEIEVAPGVVVTPPPSPTRPRRSWA